MTENVHFLIERYGLLAVLFGCMAEGESVAILAGFFAHQSVFAPWQAFFVAFLGAFLGDVVFFTLGRAFSQHPVVVRLKTRPGFAGAYDLVQRHPDGFVLSNRFIYGLRLVGGVAAGLSTIQTPRFLLLNALSSLVWAGVFCTLGFVFGLGAEHIVGNALLRHERLLVALGLAVTATILGIVAARHFVARRRSSVGNGTERP